MKNNFIEKDTVVIFSQAPADIQYVLSLYELKKSKSKVVIIVVNVKNNFEYLLSLNLDAKLEFIPLVKTKDTIKFLKHAFMLSRIRRKTFGNMVISEIYFFANNSDYVTAYFIARLSKLHRTYFIDIYKTTGKSLTGSAFSLKALLILLVLGVRIRFFLYSGRPVYQFVFSGRDISTIDLDIDSRLLLRYMLDVDTSGSPAVLFFESNGQEQSWYEHYTEDLIKILDILKVSYDIYIKPHPRLGYSKDLDSAQVKVVNAHVPSEMLKLSSFRHVFGIETTSLVSANHSSKYSLIDLFLFKDNSVRNGYKKYLDNLGERKFSYIKTFDELGRLSNTDQLN